MALRWQDLPGLLFTRHSAPPRCTQRRNPGRSVRCATRMRLGRPTSIAGRASASPEGWHAVQAARVPRPPEGWHAVQAARVPRPPEGWHAPQVARVPLPPGAEASGLRATPVQTGFRSALGLGRHSLARFHRAPLCSAVALAPRGAGMPQAARVPRPPGAEASGLRATPVQTGFRRALGLGRHSLARFQRAPVCSAVALAPRGAGIPHGVEMPRGRVTPFPRGVGRPRGPMMPFPCAAGRPCWPALTNYGSSSASGSSRGSSASGR